MERWLFVPKPFASWWVGATVALGERVATTERLILATMSPFESGDAARRLSARLGIPWVADLRDPWALDEMQIYPSALHRKVEMRRMERLLSSASVIVMNTPEATSVLRNTFPRLREVPIVTITNGFDAADFDGPPPARTMPVSESSTPAAFIPMTACGSESARTVCSAARAPTSMS